MDGLVAKVTAYIAGLADQGGHGRGQAAGVILLGAATSGSLIATQLAATVLITVLMMASLMHITASVSNPSGHAGDSHVDFARGLPGASDTHGTPSQSPAA